MNENKIDTFNVSSNFESHISQKYNKRIIFSGQFGSGKTSFLRDFFELKNEQYNSFWLSPVNYSVASNEDILEYIKFDLVVDLIQKHLIPQKIVAIPEGLIIWSYMNNNFENLINAFLTGLSDIKPETSIVKSIVNQAIKTFNNYTSYREKFIKEHRDDSELLMDYVSTGLNKKGSIFEDDIITQTIRAYLEFFKEKGKENVLIIDDFDRLDPEHIFRILNIFSLHNDYLTSTYENKFGFDKVILVCDIDSIQNYYYHKYGQNSNFAGYIDKFCSTKYFRFSIDEMVEDFCRHYIRIDELNQDSIVTLSQILAFLIKNKKITLRNLVKFFHRKECKEFVLIDGNRFKLEEYCKTHRFVETTKLYINSSDFPFLHGIGILADIAGDVKTLINICDELSNKKERIDISRLTNITNSLCLLSHLTKNYQNIETLCFSPSDNDYGHPRTNSKHFNHPKTYFLERNIAIKLKWNISGAYRYSGNESYFNGSTLSQPDWNEKHVSVGLLFLELHHILLFLDKQKMFNKL